MKPKGLRAKRRAWHPVAHLGVFVRDAGSRKHLKTGRQKTMSRGLGFYSGSPRGAPPGGQRGPGTGDTPASLPLYSVMKLQPPATTRHPRTGGAGPQTPPAAPALGHLQCRGPQFDSWVGKISRERVKKAECQRTDAFELWYWRRLLRVPWTVRRSNQSILKDFSLRTSLKLLMHLLR